MNVSPAEENATRIEENNDETTCFLRCVRNNRHPRAPHSYLNLESMRMSKERGGRGSSCLYNHRERVLELKSCQTLTLLTKMEMKDKQKLSPSSISGKKCFAPCEIKPSTEKFVM